MEKTEENFLELWDNYKMRNINIMKLPEGKERGKNQKNYLKQ